MLHIPMVMMLHTFENTVDSRLGSFGMTAGKLVPVVNFYKDPTATGVARIFDWRETTARPDRRLGGGVSPLTNF